MFRTLIIIEIEKLHRYVFDVCYRCDYQIKSRDKLIIYFYNFLTKRYNNWRYELHQIIKDINIKRYNDYNRNMKKLLSIISSLDGTTKSFESGDFVVYIPNYLLTGHKSNMIQDKNLGMVKSKNDKYVFVRFYSGDTAAACDPKDLFRLDNRPDLIEKCIKKLEL